MPNLQHFLSWVLLRVLACAVVLFGIGPFESYDSLLPSALSTAASSFNRIYAAPSQDEIAVVLVDDDDLQALAADWPLPHGYWEEALQRLRCAGVGAIFFDVILTRAGESAARPDDGSRASAPTDGCPDAAVGTTSPPVFVADTARGSARSDLAPRDRRLLVEWQGPDGDYPLTIAGATGMQFSAAYRLFDVVCKSGRKPAPAGCAEPPTAADLRQRVLPRWTMRWPTEQDAWRDGRSICGTDQPTGFFDALRLWLLEFRSGPDAHAGCRPFLTLSLDQLLHDFDANMARVLSGRVVLVGASVGGAGDTVRLQTHGALPRVYVHATVLENLLSMGAGFDRIDPGLLYVALGALITLVSIVVWALERRYGTVEALPRTVFAALIALTFAACVIVLRWALLPPGQVPSAAFALTLGMLLGELSHEGRLFNWLRKLQPAERSVER